jgi:hypothetical protein
VLTVYDLAPTPDLGDFQLWMSDPNSKDPSSESSCAVFGSPGTSGEFSREIVMAGPGLEGVRFYLIYGKKGGAATLKEALDQGSIVLASPRR